MFAISGFSAQLSKKHNPNKLPAPDLVTQFFLGEIQDTSEKITDFIEDECLPYIM